MCCIVWGNCVVHGRVHGRCVKILVAWVMGWAMRSGGGRTERPVETGATLTALLKNSFNNLKVWLNPPPLNEQAICTCGGRRAGNATGSPAAFPPPLRFMSFRTLLMKGKTRVCIWDYSPPGRKLGVGSKRGKIKRNLKIQR
jgi:hypothetical protein